MIYLGIYTHTVTICSYYSYSVKGLINLCGFCLTWSNRGKWHMLKNLIENKLPLHALYCFTFLKSYSMQEKLKFD